MTDVKQLYEKELRFYRRYLIAEGYRNTTVKTYTLKIQVFLKWIKEESIDYKKLSQSDVIRFRNHQQSKGKKIESLNQILSSIVQFYDDLQIRGVVKINPAENITAGKRTTKVFAGKIQYDKLIELYDSFEPGETDFMGIRNKVIYSLYIFQGVQSSELKRMSVCDIDFKAGTIDIPSGSRSLGRTLMIHPKQSYYIQLYIEKIRSELLGIKGYESDKLILSQGSSTEIQNALSSCLRRLKQKDDSINSWSQIRGSVICYWLESKVDVFEVKRLSGHKYIDSTERYLRSITDLKMQAELDMLFPIV